VDVLITGHTHIPLYVRVKEGCVVNPGSVFTLESERGSSETYGVLNLDDLAFDLYDLTATLVEPHTL
jgi:predicted phosphodiesterase